MSIKISTMTTGSSRFTGKPDVAAGPLDLTTTGVLQEVIPGDQANGGKTVFTLGFKEITKRLILNQTTIKRCAAAWGSDTTDTWVNQHGRLSLDPFVMYKGQQVGGLNFQPFPPAAPAHAPTPTQTPAAGVAPGRRTKVKTALVNPAPKEEDFEDDSKIP